MVRQVRHNTSAPPPFGCAEPEYILWCIVSGAPSSSFNGWVSGVSFWLANCTCSVKMSYMHGRHMHGRHMHGRHMHGRHM